MRMLPPLLASLLVLAVPAHGLTPDQIEAGAVKAGKGLRPIVRKLANDRLAGRDNNTPESDKAQATLVRRLHRLGPGLNTEASGFDAYRQPFVQGGETGTNLLAFIPGRELPEEYVIIGAHYDHLDTRSNAAGSCSIARPPGGEICNGATDNATGVAVALAVGRAIKRLPERPRRSVIVALWDAEEDGLLGSLYYVNQPLVPIGSTRAYVNLDIQGADLLPSLSAMSVAVSAETGGATLQGLVSDAVAADAIDTRPLSYIFGQLRSDYANFVAKQVPTVFFTDATNGCYHTTGDDLSIVNWDKLAAQSRVAFRVTAALAEAAAPPAFVPPNPGLATFADAVSLDALLTPGLTDLPLFSPADQVLVQGVYDDIHAIVTDGSAAFDVADATTLVTAPLDLLAAIARLGCLPR